MSGEETTTETTEAGRGLNQETEETTVTSDVDQTTENTGETTENVTETTETETETKDETGAFGAPEAYDFKGLNLPEGYTIDEELAAKFAPIGKELNLSQESANKLANLLVQSQQKMLSSVSQQFAEYKKQEQEAVNLGYEKLLNEDKEISGGGDEAKRNAYLDVADVGYNNFATPALKSVLSKLHLDYHPDVIKLFHRLGKLCGSDKIIQSNKPVSATQNTADLIYGQKTEAE